MARSTHAWTGALDYTVLVGYGMPEQQFPVFLGTSSSGMSLLRCKPCASGSDNCDPAFNTSRSSTFAQVPCGSPDCPTKCSGSVCPLVGTHSTKPIGTFSRDVLTLTPSTAIHDFRFVCMDVKHHPDVLPQVGILDLSRDRNSLPSRLSSSPALAFSYCLPRSPTSQGFLSLSHDGTVRDDNRTAVHAPLLSHEGNAELESMCTSSSSSG
jgi:hypothetical protein